MSREGGQGVFYRRKEKCKELSLFIIDYIFEELRYGFSLSVPSVG